jgi:protein-S-isoprenylcysteine O-methyltransferase
MASTDETLDGAIETPRTFPISRPFNTRTVPNPINQINSGGIGPNSNFAEMPTPAVPDLHKPYLRHGPKSLSGIAIRGFLLGMAFSSFFILTIILLTQGNTLWRAPFFIAALSLFHFLEFWTTAAYNTPAAQISSYLLSSNGSAYNIAHTTALLECIITNSVFNNRQWAPDWVANVLLIVGLGMISVGQVVRSVAMIQAGTNFNHVVQTSRSNSHQLVTSGIYGYLRHPSYFGFFWWGLGTQLVLGNPFSFTGYAAVLWRFFSRRIQGKWTHL